MLKSGSTLMDAGTETEERSTLLARLASARAATDHVFSLVKDGFLYERPIPERHRIIFYVGHLEAFDWNLLQARLPGLKPIDPSLDRLFAFGIDPVDGGLPDDQPEDWPSLAKVTEYKDNIRTALDTALAGTTFSDWNSAEQPATILNTAIEHRLMHAETLAYMLHRLPFDQKHRQAQAPLTPAGLPEPQMIEIPRGYSALGLAADSSEFGWDNEYQLHSVPVERFLIDRYKVTNGEYLGFLEAGGYQNAALWTAADWEWRSRHDITHPAFWSKPGGAWLYRGMFDETPLPLNHPVYVSHAEARAYANWAGKRLPTEAEWHRAAFDSSNHRFPAADTSGSGYIEDSRWDPLPVNTVPQGLSPFGVEGMIGNGWEWTISLFEPFDGFKSFPFYEGYSSAFFDAKHFVLKGGSTRTDRCMLRRSFRNWFQPHYQYIYAGFRCVVS
jgi:gamma-glutamyl hercynylcysteine S-oxide synthase